MYRILLVDDEAVSLRLLHNLVSAYFPQFEIAGEFESGIDALNFFRDNPVDLIVTDVKMPVMNGVELAKCVRRMSAQVHIVIVSGYAEFDFAKGAIEAEVDEYLLKPISLPHLTRALSAILEKLDAQRAAQRRQLLLDVLSGKNVRPEEFARCFDSTGCCIGVMRLGNLYPRHVPAPYQEQITLQALGASHIHLLDGRDCFERVLVSTQPIAPREVCQGLTKDRAVTLIVDGALLAFPQLPSRLRRLFSLLDANVILGKTQLLDAATLQPRAPRRLEPSELHKIDYALSSGNLELLGQTLADWGSAWAGAPQLWVEKSVQRILDRCLAQTPSLQEKHIQLQAEVDALYPKAAGTEALMAGVFAILKAAIRQSGEGRKSPGALYEQIEKYIGEHYAQPLTMQSLCTAMGISQTYLSKLFRVYGQKSFNELLTAVRIENACRLLSRNQKARMSDISAMVGYDDQSYFCKVFRQSVGMTPGQYARAHARQRAESGEARP